MKIAWLTDIHLNKVTDNHRVAFYGRLRKADFDAVVITGDISEARLLPAHLRELGRACSPRKVYFVLGNHDFYGSCFVDVDRAVAMVCKEQSNLHHLGHGERIPMGANSVLIGHRGWADGRAGWGKRSLARNPDRKGIADFRGLSRQAAFGLMEDLGKASGKYFRDILPYALKCYEHVWLATHVPPFTQAAFYDGKPCDCVRQPFYSNISAGGVINGIAGSYRNRKITVLCGHTHSQARAMISDRVWVLAGKAKPGWPQIQETFKWN